ncbi:UNVERIFIED_CONTAM: Zinc finger BED domain-containing protein RICESLEEPER 2 [Sesamum radiatum]|uniref:Zinc finger BED domain-containing protein RICESLEEPER 2 n=1 Tax=Sesamum radiatum TaxID=300843 RepID=A0AAW2RDX6_SESRA
MSKDVTDKVDIEETSQDNSKRKRTSAVWNHFKRIKVEDQKVSGTQELGTQIFSQEETRRELASMVILHDYPLSIVDHIGFRRYSTSLQPRFNMISRNTLKNDILKIYKEQRMKYYNLLEKLKCRIAVTTDMWTSSNSNRGFMAVTGHFIDDHWILQSCILRFAYVPAPHTAEVIADTLVDALMD